MHQAALPSLLPFSLSGLLFCNDHVIRKRTGQRSKSGICIWDTTNMQSSKSSSPASSEIAQKTSPCASSWARRSPSSLDAANINPNPPKSLEGELSSKAVPSPDQQQKRGNQESIRGLKRWGSLSGRNLERFLKNPMASDSTQPQEEITRLQRELRLAIEAEEKSNRAMDTLALAITEVTTEMNQLKKQLSVKESELERLRVEADHSKSMLEATKDKFHMVLVELERLRLEAEESAAAWGAKEEGFISCMKESEEETTRVMQENNSLLGSQKAAREENSRLRDIMKQALNEANVVKGALEIARRENSQLKDLLSEKESSLEAIKQEYDSLKVSEAAALHSVNELKNSLSASSTAEANRNGRSDDLSGSFEKQGTRKKAMVPRSPSERRSNDVPDKQNWLKLPRASSGSFQGTVSRKKDGKYGSLGCVSDVTVHSLRRLRNGEALNSGGDVDHAERIHLNGMNNESDSAPKKKKKSLLRKFSEAMERNYSRCGAPTPN
uniref:WEB family protein At3g02930, chloroplastic n=1 Tax=Anthurium amnicola TaxID=1678845 RepID=A0A1D1Z0B6_9ARAE